jgi:hypothetical protein
MRKLLAVLLMSGVCLAQTNSVGPQVAAYTLTSGTWSPAITTFSDFAIDNTAAVELYCFNTTTNKWVPWTSECGGSSGGGIPPGPAAFTGDVTAVNSVAALAGTGSPNPAATVSSTQLFTTTSGNQSNVIFTDASRTANNRLAFLGWSAGTFKIALANDAFNAATPSAFAVTGGQQLGITGITSNSGTGTWLHTGSFSTTGNLTVQGSLSSTANAQPASITNTGTAIAAASTNTNILMYNSTYTANNRTAEHIWFNNCMQSRFKNDAQDTAVTPLSLCGGQGTGITGITSNSGSGVWAHTGNFSVSGTITQAGSPLTGTIASGSTALSTAAIASGACATVVTATATGVLTTDAISWNPNASIKAVTGYAPSTTGGLSIAAYPTAGGVNFDVCNSSASSITPGAVTINWRVTR